MPRRHANPCGKCAKADFPSGQACGGLLRKYSLRRDFCRSAGHVTLPTPTFPFVVVTGEHRSMACLTSPSSVPLPRAREAESAASLLELATMPSSELKRSLRRLKRSVNRMAWRRACQRRTSFVSGLLRVAEKSVSSYAGRRKNGPVWRLMANDAGASVPVLELCIPAAHDVKTFGGPITVEILRRDLVDAERIERWVTRMRDETAKREMGDSP